MNISTSKVQGFVNRATFQPVTPSEWRQLFLGPTQFHARSQLRKLFRSSRSGFHIGAIKAFQRLGDFSVVANALIHLLLRNDGQLFRANTIALLLRNNGSFLGQTVVGPKLYHFHLAKIYGIQTFMFRMTERLAQTPMLCSFRMTALLKTTYTRHFDDRRNLQNYWGCCVR